ncbi:MAG: GNAT family N-acetyltransferase [Calditrichaceae bacterium]
MDISIKKAEKSDLPDILALYAESDIDNGKKLDIDVAEELFDKIRAYPNYNVYIAIHKDEIVGTFELLIMDNLAHMGAPSAIVEDVVVHKDYRGKGIGKQMMYFALNDSKKAGCYKMVLSSNMQRERAHHFYESLGYEKYGFGFRLDFET